jgi:enterochelin esterase family protein
VPVEISADDGSVRFELVDRARRLAAVRLVQEIGLAEPVDFSRTSGRWRLELPRPDVDRLEYLLEVEDHNGHRTTIPDPDNPLRTGGAFSDKSVVEFPEYRRPDWLTATPPPGLRRTVEIDVTGLDAVVAATVWTPSGLEPGTAAPLVVVHDGPEYDRLGDLTHYLGAAICAGRLPPLRAALLDPGDRNDWYAANPAYAQALCADVLPALDAVAPSTARLGVGVSLGGLAMLHAHRRHPGAFAALLLQSASFFTPELDAQESGFPGFAAVTGFVAEVAGAAEDRQPVPAVLTCGVVEENLANNEAMAGHLRRLGYGVEFVPVRDAHNYTAWRDGLDRSLPGLVEAVVGRRTRRTHPAEEVSS